MRGRFCWRGLGRLEEYWIMDWVWPPRINDRLLKWGCTLHLKCLVFGASESIFSAREFNIFCNMEIFKKDDGIEKTWDVWFGSVWCDLFICWENKIFFQGIENCSMLVAQIKMVSSSSFFYFFKVSRKMRFNTSSWFRQIKWYHTYTSLLQFVNEFSNL